MLRHSRLLPLGGGREGATIHFYRLAPVQLARPNVVKTAVSTVTTNLMIWPISSFLFMVLLLYEKHYSFSTSFFAVSLTLRPLSSAMVCLPVPASMVRDG